VVSEGYRQSRYRSDSDSNAMRGLQSYSIVSSVWLATVTAMICVACDGTVVVSVAMMALAVSLARGISTKQISMRQLQGCDALLATRQV
jgi:hypothetical protein